MSRTRRTYKVTNISPSIMLGNIPDYHDGEYMWSYFSRLAESNGFRSSNEMFKTLWPAPRWGRLPYECNTTEVGRLLRVEGTEWLAEATTFRYMRPFTTKDFQMQFVWKAAEKRPRPMKFFHSYFKGIPRLKVCPECMKEDLAEGGFRLHTLHQVPGVDVCPVHGCHLAEYKEHAYGEDEIIPDTVMASEEDAEMARSFVQFIVYVKEHMDSISLDVTLAAIDRRLHKMLGLHEDKVLTLRFLFQDFEKKFNETCSFSYYKMQGSSIDVSCKNNIAIYRVIRRLFDSPEDFCKEAEVFLDHDLHERFLQAIEGRLELVSDYHDDIVRVRCTECGCEFNATTLAITLMPSCPECGERKSEEDLFWSMLERAGGGRFSVIPGTLDSWREVAVTDRKKCEVLKVKAYDLIFHADILKRTNVFLGGTISSFSSESYYSMVEASGPFRLIGMVNASFYGRFGPELRIVHETCGKDFRVNSAEFINNPYCPHCAQAEGMSSLISEMSGGFLTWKGDVSRKEYKVVAATGLELSADGPARLFNSIYALMLERRGEKADDPEEHMVCLRYFLENCIDWGKGKRNIYPACDSLLLHAGLHIRFPRHAVIYDGRKVPGYEEDGRTSLHLLNCRSALDDSNWRETAIILTAMHSGFISVAPEIARSVIKEWMEACGITVSSLSARVYEMRLRIDVLSWLNGEEDG